MDSFTRARWTQLVAGPLVADLLGARIAIAANERTGRVSMTVPDGAADMDPDTARLIGVRLIEAATLAAGQRAIREAEARGFPVVSKPVVIPDPPVADAVRVMHRAEQGPVVPPRLEETTYWGPNGPPTLMPRRPAPDATTEYGALALPCGPHGVRYCQMPECHLWPLEDSRAPGRESDTPVDNPTGLGTL